MYVTQMISELQKDDGLRRYGSFQPQTLISKICIQQLNRHWNYLSRYDMRKIILRFYVKSSDLKRQELLRNKPVLVGEKVRMSNELGLTQ